MIHKKIIKNLFLILISLSVFSCFDNNEKLNEEDISYIKGLELLDDGEVIIWFESQLTKKTSGNFLTNKRLASYWIDQYNESDTTIECLYLYDIDSLLLKDLSSSLTYASYIQAFAKEKSIKVYIGERDTIVLKKYFEEALKRIGKK